MTVAKMALKMDRAERQVTDALPPDRARQANGSSGRGAVREKSI